MGGDIHHRHVVYSVNAPPTSGPERMPNCPTAISNQHTVLLAHGKLRLYSLPNKSPVYTTRIQLASLSFSSPSHRIATTLLTRPLLQRRRPTQYRQRAINQPRRPQPRDRPPRNQHLRAARHAAYQAAQLEDEQVHQEDGLGAEVRVELSGEGLEGCTARGLAMMDGREGEGEGKGETCFASW